MTKGLTKEIMIRSTLRNKFNKSRTSITGKITKIKEMNV